MSSRFFLVTVVMLGCFQIAAQSSETYLKTFDPNPQYEYVYDNSGNIWSIGHFIYVTNAFGVGLHREAQIVKINADTKEIVKVVKMEGPQVDLLFSMRGGGYCLTSDNNILLTGEWRDYDHSRMRTFIAKMDPDLNLVWINYYPDLSDLHVYADAIAETPSGDILLYVTEGKPKSIEEPWFAVEGEIRIIKTDSIGNLIFNKVIPDTFLQSIGYGHLTPTEDGHYLLTSNVIGYYYHWLYGTYRYNAIMHKIDENANPIWSRLINWDKTFLQPPTVTGLSGGGGAVMWRQDTFVPDPTIAYNFSVLNRINSEGQIIWKREWNDVAIRSVYRIITAANGDILGFGYYSKDASKGKIWLFRATEAGEILWERHYSDSIQRPWSPFMEMFDMCELADGRIATTGVVFDTNSIGSLNPNIGILVVGGADGCMDTGCSGLTQYITSAFEPIIRAPQLPQLICSPNPAQDMALIQLPDRELHQSDATILKCYDMQGRLMVEIPWAKGQDGVPMDVKNWPSGIYQLLLWADRKPLCSGKLIVQH
jgi:hypothetical protein